MQDPVAFIGCDVSAADACMLMLYHVVHKLSLKVVNG